MSASRESILRRLRETRVPRHHPAAAAWSPLRYADPLGEFEQRLEVAGGSCVEIAGRDELAAALGALAPFRDAEKIASPLPEILSTWDAADPRGWAELDFAVLEGQLAVAESGAVWVAPSDSERSACFLAEHLALVVRRDSLVHNLHEAYAVLDPSRSAFGCFIAGPSKTADIEQALVIGAHGPRSLVVVFWG